MDFDSASARLVMRPIRLVIGWSADDLSETGSETLRKASEGPRRRVVQAKEEWKQGSYRGERVGLCAARQELPVL